MTADSALGDQILGFLAALDAIVDDVLGGENQMPQQRFVFDDLEIAVDRIQTRQPVGQGRNIGNPVDRLELGVLFEFVDEREVFDAFAPRMQIHHTQEDATVLFDVEITAVDHPGDLRKKCVIEKHRPEHELFGFEIGRKTSFQGKSCTVRSHCSALARLG